MAEVDRILIVGGGIAGLTVAAALKKYDFDAELVERSPTWDHIATGAAIGVQPNGMRVMNALGMAREIEAAGWANRRWCFCDERGDLLSETDLDALWNGIGRWVAIERTKLHHILLEGANGVPQRLGLSVTSLSQSDRHVNVGFSDASCDEYALVIGADGIRSTVRSLAISDNPPQDLSAMNWRSIVPTRPKGLTGLHFFLGERRFFGLCPVGETRTYGFGYVMQPRERDPVKGRIDRLRKRFEGFGGFVLEYLTALEHDEQVHCSAMEWIQVDEWYRGRVVLIGDAAHASSPLLGQGGCQAMEDALVLGQALRSADSVENALDRYVKRRKPRVEWVQSQSIATAERLRELPKLRNEALRAGGDQMMRSRFGPLVTPP